MKLTAKQPIEAINKAYLKDKPTQGQFDQFVASLKYLLQRVESAEGQTEEHYKNYLQDFFNAIGYAGNHDILPWSFKGLIEADLVIHKGANKGNNTHGDHPAGVIVEIKKPRSREMPTPNEPNRKALQEAILYLLYENFGKNHRNRGYVQNLLLTDFDTWMVIRTERLKPLLNRLKKSFEDWERGERTSSRTDFMHEEIARGLLEIYPASTEDEGLVAACFDLRKDYLPLLENPYEEKNRKKLVALYVLLSPRYLLQLPPENDSNILNQRFYEELLYVLGLHEVERDGKKLIERLPEKQRQAGSFMEQAIRHLNRTKDHLKYEFITLYDEKDLDKQTFGLALELYTTWVNRLLFLKLLEAQLISWHGDAGRAFLNIETVEDPHGVRDLFFEALNQPEDQRDERLKPELRRLPYLNSSLFEPTDLESYMSVEQIRERDFDSLWGKTVLATEGGKVPNPPKGPFDYLFRFLNAYDFGAEADSDDLKKNYRALINAPVLGLIFEKINGYKDGSFYTPSFITMYMCRLSVRRALASKLKTLAGLPADSYETLRSATRRMTLQERRQLAQTAEKLTICDPAVGSGHFLVSALNETIFALSDLYLLFDDDGNELEHSVIVSENDELIVTDRFNELIRYEVKTDPLGRIIPDQKAENVQRALFQVKRRLIENSLFGVDVNPNSVQICRLRLWIELLKSSYYNPQGRLETLPNLDLNVRFGNSLVSRTPINIALTNALKGAKDENGKPLTYKKYRETVQQFRKATQRDSKQRLRAMIDANLKVLENEAGLDRKKELSNLQGNVESLRNLLQDGSELFEMGAAERKARAAQLKTAEKALADFNQQSEQQQSYAYANAFEWRYEIPEILNDKGDFIGFDVVVANPPYMRIQEITRTQPQFIPVYQALYQNAAGSFDLANLFFERAQQLCAPTGTAAFIMPHKFLNSDNASGFRERLNEKRPIFRLTHFGANMVFGGADTYTSLVFFDRQTHDALRFRRIPLKDDFPAEIAKEDAYLDVEYKSILRNAQLYGSNQWILFDQEAEYSIFNKIYENSVRLEEVFQRVFQGIATGKDPAYIFQGIDKGSYLEGEFLIENKQRRIEKTFMKAFAKGADIHRFAVIDTNKFIFFPYVLDKEGKAHLVNEIDIKEQSPLLYDYIKKYEPEFRNKDSRKTDDSHWFRYARKQGIDYVEIPKLSSMEICSKHPNVTFNPNGVYHPTTVYSWVKKPDVEESYLYFMAIANSALMWWFLKHTGDTLQGDARRLKTNYLNPFPFPRNPDSQTVAAIERLAQRVLDLHAEGTPAQAEERELDDLVCDLYGFEADERALLRSV